MSGQQIGTVVGGVIGSFFGMTQIGMAIGGMIGGAVDPTKIQGPRLQDASVQTARDGVPIPWGYGTFPTMGNVIWTGELVEHSETDDGKGSGTEVETFTYTRSYAIAICEGPITGILQIKRNGKVVYDASTSEAIRARYEAHAASDDALRNLISKFYAQKYKFLLGTALYLGDESQMPDPTIEAKEGAGNVSPFRGIAYMVVEDDDVTELGGAIPQYEFVVAGAGTVGPEAGTYAPLDFDGPTPWQDNAPALRDPRIPGVTYEYGSAHASSDYTEIVWRATVTEAIADHEILYGLTSISTPELMGWTTQFGGIDPDDPVAPWEDITGESWADRYVLGLCYSRYLGDDQTTTALIYQAGGATSGTGACNYYPTPTWAARLEGNDTGSEPPRRRNVTIQQGSVGPAGADHTYACYDGGSFNATGLNAYSGFVIACRPVPSCFSSIESGALELPDSPGQYASESGHVLPSLTSQEVAGAFKQLSLLTHSTDGGVTPTAKIETSPVGPVLSSLDDDYGNQPFWDDAYAEAVAAGTMEAGLSYSDTGLGGVTTYPRVTASACEQIPDGETIALDAIPLSEIVADLCQREGLTAAQYDVSQLTDMVKGYRVANEGAADAMISPLQSAYFFDVGEWDGKLRFIKRGGEPVATLTMDDLAERDGDAIEQQRVQEAELLRRVTVGYLDPAAGYTATTQKWERRAATINAKGEASVEIPVVGDANFGASVAAKRGKVAWSETEVFKKSLPYRFAALTPTDVILQTDAKGKQHRMRYMGIDDDSGVRLIEATLDRQATYTGTATGVAPVPPTIPPSNLRGPTRFIAMNLPQLRTQDSTPGMYVAAAGVLSGWTGCVLQLSVDGGLSFRNVLTMDNAATMGELTDALAVSGTPLSVSVRGLLSSVTSDQVADGRANAFAIVGAAANEVGQFQTATLGVVDGTLNSYDLTVLSRGQLGTTEAAHVSGEAFVLLDGAVYFLPIDSSHSGKTLIFRAVTIGTPADNNATFSVVYDAPTYIRHGGVVTP